MHSRSETFVSPASSFNEMAVDLRLEPSTQRSGRRERHNLAHEAPSYVAVVNGTIVADLAQPLSQEQILTVTRWRARLPGSHGEASWRREL